MNLPTVLVLLALLFVVYLAIRSVARDGTCGCGGNCSGCGAACNCAAQKPKKKRKV